MIAAAEVPHRKNAGVVASLTWLWLTIAMRSAPMWSSLTRDVVTAMPSLMWSSSTWSTSH
jgi:hypothetical protein